MKPAEQLLELTVNFVSGKEMKFYGADAKAAATAIEKTGAFNAAHAVFHEDRLNRQIEIRMQNVESIVHDYGTPEIY